MIAGRTAWRRFTCVSGRCLSARGSYSEMSRKGEACIRPRSNFRSHTPWPKRSHGVSKLGESAALPGRGT